MIRIKMSFSIKKSFIYSAANVTMMKQKLQNACSEIFEELKYTEVKVIQQQHSEETFIYFLFIK